MHTLIILNTVVLDGEGGCNPVWYFNLVEKSTFLFLWREVVVCFHGLETAGEGEYVSLL